MRTPGTHAALYFDKSNTSWKLITQGEYDKCLADAQEFVAADPSRIVSVVHVLVAAQPWTHWDTVAERALKL